MSISDDDLPPGLIRSRPRSGPQISSPQPTGRSEHATWPERAEKPRSETDADLHFDPVGKAREDAYFFLSYRDRSEKEMIDRLRKRKHSDEAIDEVLAHLRAEGYLNDASFARRLVESRGKTRGARALSFELRQKGIDGEVAEEALAERSGDEAERAAAWLAATRRVGEPPVADVSPAAAKRLSAFLQRRGFSYGTVRSVLRELFAADGGMSESLEEQPE